MNKGIQAYQKTIQGPSTEAWIVQHANLVKRIALHLKNRLPHSVQLEDLIQAGMIGLIEASQRYDASNSASFETFAGIRIRGAMLDELRKNHWATRSTHQNIRKISEAIHAVEKRQQQSATAQEIAEELNISVEEYYQILDVTAANEWVSLDDVSESQFIEQVEDNPEKLSIKSDLARLLSEELKKLPEREQLILSLYYNEEFNFKEIAKILEITEARVSQLHSQAILRLNGRCQGKS